MKKQLAIIGITTDIDVQGGFFLLANAKYLIGKEIPHSIAVALNEGKKIEISELHEKIGSTLFKNDVDIASYLLHAAGVAVIPGSGFGIEPDAGYLRFSCAQPMELLQKAILQITESLKYFKQQKNEYVPMFEAINSSYLDLLFSASHTLEIASQDDFIPESNLIYDPAKYNC